MKEIVGYILIVAGVADFLLGNFAQINLTYFLGSLSTFSPYVLGGLGWLILNSNPNNEDYDDPALDRFKKKSKKK